MTQEQYNTLWDLLNVAVNGTDDYTIYSNYGSAQMALHQQYPDLDNNRSL